MPSRMLLVTLLLVAGLACSPDSSSPPDSAEDSTDAAVELDEVVSATVGGEDANIKIKVRAQMPEDFDDGVPERRFSGEGVLDQDEDLSGVTYKLASAPNAAGYFGQADGKTSVYYTEDAFVLSFPLLAEALAAPLDWFRYEVDDFADPRLLDLGIGQLREIGFADPRLALALLKGGPEELPPLPEPTPGVMGEPVLEFDVDVATAAGAEGNILEIPFAALEDLGVETVEMGLAVDEEQRVKTLTYRLSYPPAPGSKPVKLRVQIDFVEYGMEGDLKLPPEETVADYEEYLAQ